MIITRRWIMFCAGWKAFLCASGCQVQEASVACATGPEASLYIADSHHGRIWRIVHKDWQF